MRPIIQFILIAAILTLTIFAWNVNSSQIDSAFPKDVAEKLQEVDNIRRITDVELLREKAIAGVIGSKDDNSFTRGTTFMKLGYLLMLILALTITAQIIAFFEIAARGKLPPTKAMRQPGRDSKFKQLS